MVIVATVEGRMVVAVGSAAVVLFDAGIGPCTGVMTLMLAPWFCNSTLATSLISRNKAQHTSTLMIIATNAATSSTKTTAIQATIPQHVPQHHLR